MKKNKILWATPNHLLDTSSGASLSVREILMQLIKYGYEVKILGSTIFDADSGNTYLKKYEESFLENQNRFVNIEDGPLIHQTLITKESTRPNMRSYEERLFYQMYCKILDEFKPDTVFYYGSAPLELHIASEAKMRDILVMLYMANSSFSGDRIIRDVDCILTDSNATAEMYKNKENYDLKAIGKFINKEKYIAKNIQRKNVLFINPSITKGAAIVVQLALYLENIRPEIKIEVVESRGKWKPIVEGVSAVFGEKRSDLKNVIVTSNTQNMKDIYSRTRILLVPSLLWESASRVIIEAQYNGIPVFGTNRGGIPEMIGEGGILLNFSEDLFKEPFNKCIDESYIQKIALNIIRMYDDKEYYQSMSNKAILNSEEKHNIEKNTQKLIDIIQECHKSIVNQ